MTKPERRFAAAAFVAALAVVLAMAPIDVVSARGPKDRTATIDFPRHGDSAPLELGCGPVSVRSVRIDSPPSAADLEKARRDPDDTTRLRWWFNVANSGRKKWEAKIHVTVYDADDRVLGDESRTDSISSHTGGDHISVWTRIRTADYRRADHVRVNISCDRD